MYHDEKMKREKKESKWPHMINQQGRLEGNDK